MRCNQVSIGIERFGEYVPKNYPGNVQRISVYVDDFTSIYAALSKAYALAINELAEYDHIGAHTNVRTNEYAGVNYKKCMGSYQRKDEPMKRMSILNMRIRIMSYARTISGYMSIVQKSLMPSKTAEILVK